ncbi:hypothetical protein Patl1_36223 [Pistacia atlantica]|nr:hypothetical protein Patl1_36223 [Pistacia atlantica]
MRANPYHSHLLSSTQLQTPSLMALHGLKDIDKLGVKVLWKDCFSEKNFCEMSYCAHEKKLFFVPVPLLIGMVIADILRETTLEISPLLKDAEVPWHLIAIAIFFTLLKLPGPYYPYWGRIFIPHFANGVLLRTLWFAFLWYRKPKKASETKQPNTTQ